MLHRYLVTVLFFAATFLPTTPMEYHTFQIGQYDNQAGGYSMSADPGAIQITTAFNGYLMYYVRNGKLTTSLPVSSAPLLPNRPFLFNRDEDDNYNFGPYMQSGGISGKGQNQNWFRYSYLLIAALACACGGTGYFVGRSIRK